MAGLNFVELTKPISTEDPCGPDLEDDLDFMNATARLEVALPASYFRRDDDGRQVAFDRTSIEFPAAFADLGQEPFYLSTARVDVLKRVDVVVRAFRDILAEAGYITTVRKTRGEDIDAACGQLAGQVQDKTRRTAGRVIPIQEARH